RPAPPDRGQSPAQTAPPDTYPPTPRLPRNPAQGGISCPSCLYLSPNPMGTGAGFLAVFGGIQRAVRGGFEARSASGCRASVWRRILTVPPESPGRPDATLPMNPC